MHKITVDDITIDVERKDIKHLHLVVYPPDGRVRISAPRRIDDETVRSFAVSKLKWIKRHRERLKKQKRQSSQKYVSGERHYFKGKRYVLHVIYQSPPLPNKVKIRDKKYLDLYVRQGSRRDQRKRLLTEWYRVQLKEMIPDLIEKWERKIGVTVHEWGVKQMKTKWGSCNLTAKRVWMNLELAKRPPLCLEYILVHELVHFLVPHHNRRFNGFMDKFLPDWESLQTELNKYPIRFGDEGY
jgi:predicted metal-dependent hydrolase